MLFAGAFASAGLPVGIAVASGLKTSGDEVWALLAGVAVYSVLWLYGIVRVGQWAGQYVPPEAIQPAAAGELRRRILALNDLDLPFHIREDPKGYLIAEWKLVDARWVGLMESGGLRIANRVRMRIAERKRQVRVVDLQTRISWRGGIARAGWFGSFQFFRGIQFAEYEAAAEYGLLLKDGRWQLAEAYKYSFTLDELKQPLMQAVVLSGWIWQPVVFG